MIWEYQRSPTLTIVWNEPISLVPGQRIKAIGHFLEPRRPTEIQATTIIERDGTIHEMPISIAQSSQKGEPYPVEGKVVSCTIHLGKTFINLYQIVPNLFSFPSLSDNRAFLVVPEFWNFLEEKSEYEELVVPKHTQLAKLTQSKHKRKDLRDYQWSIHRYGVLSGRLTDNFIPEICGTISAKLDHLERLTRRASYANRMKLHLMTLAMSSGRSFLLDELAYEGPMTFEHASFLVYSILDVCASLLNQVLGLGIADRQVSFTSVLGKEGTILESASLRRDWPELPLTQFWVSQQDQWVLRLRSVRHFFAHEGTAIRMCGPSERVLTSFFTNSFENPNEIYDVEIEISQWLLLVTEFYSISLQLLSDFCLEAVRPFEESPKIDEAKAPSHGMDIDLAFRDLLKLLRQSDEENPDRIKHLYFRLEKSWQQSWAFTKFSAFMLTWDSINPTFKNGVLSSTDGEVSSMSVTCSYFVNGIPMDWLIKLEKRQNGKPYLAKNDLTRPAFPEKICSIASYSAKQSGPETGHCCAEFELLVKNVLRESIFDVQVLFTHGGMVVARCSMGTLLAGEEMKVYAITSPELGTWRPPGGPYFFVILTSEPITVRVLYSRETEFGGEWAENHLCHNSH